MFRELQHGDGCDDQNQNDCADNFAHCREDYGRPQNANAKVVEESFVAVGPPKPTVDGKQETYDEIGGNEFLLFSQDDLPCVDNRFLAFFLTAAWDEAVRSGIELNQAR